MNLIREFFHSNKRKRFYSDLIGKEDLCFDIGANLGNKSKLLLSTGAKIIAFEPQTACHKNLADIKSKYSNFEFYPFAVGATEGIKELHLSNEIEVATLSNEFIDYFTCDEVYWDQTESVVVKTIDQLITDYGLPYFCKIDVEGYEWEILSNLSYKIPLIEFEFTGGFVEDTVKIVNLLCMGNSKFNYTLNERPKFQLENWVSADEMIPIIKTLPRERLHGNIFVKS